MVEHLQHQRRQQRADLIEDLLTGVVQSDKGARAALKRAKDMRKT